MEFMNYKQKRHLYGSVAWVLLLIMLVNCISPIGRAMAKSKVTNNWDVSYSLSTASDAEEIQLEDHEDMIAVDAKEDEDVYLTMQLIALKDGADRFRDEFEFTVPENIYEALVDENGSEDSWFDFLELKERQIGGSEAEVTVASDSNLASPSAPKASASDLEDGMVRLVFRFTEELRTAEHPEEVDMDAETAVLAFAAPRRMRMMLTQDGNDFVIRARQTKEEPVPQKEPITLEVSISKDLTLPKKFYESIEAESTYYYQKHTVTVRVAYSIESHEEYPAGTMKINLNALESAFSEATRNADASTQATHKPKYKVSSNGWDYEYNESEGMFVFSNTEDFKVNQPYQGYLEVLWTFYASQMPFEQEFQATLDDGKGSGELESNASELIHKKVLKPEVGVTKSALNASSLLSSVSKLPAGYENYFWVRYYLYGYPGTAAWLFAEYEMVDDLPDDCIVLDGSLNKVNLGDDNKLVFDGEIKMSGESGISGGYYSGYYYVGYPKWDEKTQTGYKSGQEVENIVSYKGRIEDTADEWVTKDAKTKIQLVDFDFNYTGDLYSVSKSNHDPHSVFEMEHDRNSTSYDAYFYVSGTAHYTGKPMDVVFGDDLLYISRTNGTTTRLKEDEYRFTQVNIPSFGTRTGGTLQGYKYKLEILKAGGSGYETFKTGTLPQSYVYFNTSDNVVAWRLTIEDVDQSITSGSIFTAVDVFAKNVDQGMLHNFDYIQVYIDDVLQNNVNLSNYAKFFTQDEIAAFDIETYGRYIQRATQYHTIYKTEVPSYYTGKGLSATEAEGKSNLRWTISGTMTNATEASHDNYMEKIVLYDILPAGVKLRTDMTPVTISSYYSYAIVLKDGTKISNSSERQKYFKDRTLIDVDYNYKNSGRTKVTITLDLTDNPVDVYETARSIITTSNLTWISAYLYTEISDDDISRNGGSIRNYVYSEAFSQKEGGIKYSSSSKEGSDENLSIDINDNGNDEELMARASSSYSKSLPTSSISTLKKFVRTSTTNGQFVNPYGKTGVDELYTYRLWMMTGNNYLGDIVIYDRIERGVDEHGTPLISDWLGTVNGFDTSYAASLGFKPKVLYNTSANPGSLASDSNWMPYDDSVDKTTIKSVAFDLREGKDGNPAKQEPNSELYVDIFMDAPTRDEYFANEATYENGRARNSYWTEWHLLDQVGNESGVYGGLSSNVVEVDLELKKDIEIDLKLTKVDDNGVPIKDNKAKFGLYYDDPIKPSAPKVLDEYGVPITFETSLAEGIGTSGFVLDPYQMKNDGKENYYLLCIAELEAPDGYYDLGGNYERPANRYVLKLLVVPSPTFDGTYTVRAFASNPDYYSMTYNESTKQIELTVIDYLKRAGIGLEADKRFIDMNNKDRKLKAGEFDFEAEIMFAETGAVMTVQDAPVAVGSVLDAPVDTDGTVSFPILMTDTLGDYIFKITEVPVTDSAVVDDESIYYALVTVVENLETKAYEPTIVYYGPFEEEIANVTVAKLQAQASLKLEDILFTNIVLPVEVELEGTKEFFRGVMKADLFTFKVTYADGPNKVTLVNNSSGIDTELSSGDEFNISNDVAGKLKTLPLRFTEIGEYTFWMKEDVSNKEDYIDYSDVVYKIVVNIDVDEITGLRKEPKVKVYAGANEVNDIKFTNKIKPVTSELEAEKILIGRKQEKDEFNFTAKFENASVSFDAGDVMYNPGGEGYIQLAVGNIIPGTNQEDGSISFGTMRFRKAGNYVFKVTENTVGGTTMIGDTSTYYVQFVVEADVNTGELSVTEVYGDDYDSVTDTVNVLSGGTMEGIIFLNQMKEKLTIYKKSTEDNQALKDAEFTLFWRKDSNDPWVVYDDTLKTAGDNGTVSVELPKNYWEYEYKLEETAAPTLHEISTGEIIFKVDKGGKIINLHYEGTQDHVSLSEDEKGLIVKNERIPKGSMTIYKVSTEDDAALAGAKFSLYYRELGSEDEWILFDDEIETAGDDGLAEVRLPEYYWNYEYRLVETAAPVNHEIITEEIFFTMARAAGIDLSEEHDGVTLTRDQKGLIVKNQRIPKGSIAIYKVSAENNEPLADAKFSLSYRIIDSKAAWEPHDDSIMTAGAGGSVTIRLPEYYWLYEYRLVETEAPAGFELITGEITFTVPREAGIDKLSGGDHVTLTAGQIGLVIKNTPVPKEPLVIKKISTTNRPLNGAKFTLSYREGSEAPWQPVYVDMITAGENGSITMNLIDEFWKYEYQLEETVAPSGYSKTRVGTITFKIDRETGLIINLHSTGSDGYVTLTDDGRSITVKNHTTGGGGGGTDPKPPTPTNPTNPTDPTNPSHPPVPTGPTDPIFPTVVPDPEVPRTPYTPGDPVPEGKQVVVMIDDDGVPRAYLIDQEVPLGGLVKTGDDSMGVILLTVMMLAAAGGMALVVVSRRRKTK